jgi:hypothetical protein
LINNQSFSLVSVTLSRSVSSAKINPLNLFRKFFVRALTEMKSYVTRLRNVSFF